MKRIVYCNADNHRADAQYNNGYIVVKNRYDSQCDQPSKDYGNPYPENITPTAERVKQDSKYQQDAQADSQ